MKDIFEGMHCASLTKEVNAVTTITNVDQRATKNTRFLVHIANKTVPASVGGVLGELNLV